MPEMTQVLDYQEGEEVTAEEFYRYTEALRNMENAEAINFEEELIEKNLKPATFFPSHLYLR